MRPSLQDSCSRKARSSECKRALQTCDKDVSRRFMRSVRRAQQGHSGAGVERGVGRGVREGL